MKFKGKQFFATAAAYTESSRGEISLYQEYVAEVKLYQE